MESTIISNSWPEPVQIKIKFTQTVWVSCDTPRICMPLQNEQVLNLGLWEWDKGSKRDCALGLPCMLNKHHRHEAPLSLFFYLKSIVFKLDHIHVLRAFSVSIWKQMKTADLLWCLSISLLNITRPFEVLRNGAQVMLHLSRISSQLNYSKPVI